MHKVLVPLAILELAENTIGPLHSARETYIRKMVANGILPIFVSGLMPKEAIDELYAMTEGVLAMGGSDIDPVRYGETPHPKTEVKEPLRDELELYVARKALEDRKPFLGICRGEQILAVVAGGTLVQHVPDIAPDENHFAASYDELSEERHVIRVEEGTRLRAILGREEVPVNSGHHQSVKDPGKDLRVAAASPAGIVEAIEHRDPDYFCLGVQCHPEALNGDTDEIFKAFAESLDKKRA